MTVRDPRFNKTPAHASSRTLAPFFLSTIFTLHRNQRDETPTAARRASPRWRHPREDSAAVSPFLFSSLGLLYFGRDLEKHRREPLQRRAHPPMGGRTAVERLHGGALPARALTDRGPAVILLPAVPPLRDAATTVVVDAAALCTTAARWEPEPELKHAPTIGGSRSTHAIVEASADGNSAGAWAHDDFYPHNDGGFRGISFETLTHSVSSFYHLLPQTRSAIIA
jgi:hypothetical protein